MVTGSTAHVFNIAGAHTFLTGGHTGRRRLHLAGEEGLEGSHACPDQQQRRIVLGNQGRAGQPQMPPLFKES